MTYSSPCIVCMSVLYVGISISNTCLGRLFWLDDRSSSLKKAKRTKNMCKNDKTVGCECTNLFFPLNFISHHIHLLTMHYNSSREHILLLIHHFYFAWTEYSNKCHIMIQISNFESTAKQFGQMCQTVTEVEQSCKSHNASVQTSLNAPPRTEMCHLWTVHRGTLPSPGRTAGCQHKSPSPRGGVWHTGQMRHLAGENEHKDQDTVSHVKAGRGPRPGWPRDSSVNTNSNYC